MGQEPWELITHPTWGIQRAASGTDDVDQLRIHVDSGRWTGVMIGPESEASAVELWIPKLGGPQPVPASGAGVPSSQGWQRRIVVSTRRPFSGVIEGPFDIYPYNPFAGLPAGTLAANYVHKLQVLLFDGIPPVMEPRRADARYNAALTALTATSETTLLRVANPGRAGGKLTVLPAALTASETCRLRLYGVTWNANGIYEASTVFDQTFAAADSGIERTFHWEARFDGYKMTYLGAGSPSFNLDYDLLLRDELL